MGLKYIKKSHGLRTALAVLIFQSCSNPIRLKEAPAINEIEKNTNFTIILPEDHKSGYTWNLNSAYNAKIVEKLSSVWHGSEKGIYFNFKCLSTGQTTLNFISRKYTDTAGMKTFIVKINAD